MPTCPNCSNPIGAKDKFCPYCDASTEVAYSPTTDSAGKVVAASGQISAIIKRYRDAYLVAKVVDGAGSLSKGVGIIIALVLVLIGLMLAGGGGDTAFAMGVVVIAIGVATGAWFYVVGITVATIGQILKAVLDNAVHSSPFITNEHRAKIMSLPEA